MPVSARRRAGLKTLRLCLLIRCLLIRVQTALSSLTLKSLTTSCWLLLQFLQGGELHGQQDQQPSTTGHTARNLSLSRPLVVALDTVRFPAALSRQWLRPRSFLLGTSSQMVFSRGWEQSWQASAAPQAVPRTMTRGRFRPE